jgi:hypothetical protein
MCISRRHAWLHRETNDGVWIGIWGCLGSGSGSGSGSSSGSMLSIRSKHDLCFRVSRHAPPSFTVLTLFSPFSLFVLNIAHNTPSFALPTRQRGVSWSHSTQAYYCCLQLERLIEASADLSPCGRPPTPASWASTLCLVGSVDEGASRLGGAQHPSIPSHLIRFVHLGRVWLWSRSRISSDHLIHFLVIHLDTPPHHCITTAPRPSRSPWPPLSARWHPNRHTPPLPRSRSTPRLPPRRISPNMPSASRTLTPLPLPTSTRVFTRRPSPPSVRVALPGPSRAHRPSNTRGRRVLLYSALRRALHSPSTSRAGDMRKSRSGWRSTNAGTTLRFSSGTTLMGMSCSMWTWRVSRRWASPKSERGSSS